MRVRILVSLLALAAVTAFAPRSAAGVPSPSTSSIDPCLVVCPWGDIDFTVVVRDFGYNPILYSTVQVDLCPAPGVHRCGTGPCTFTGLTNAAGEVVFSIAAGGVEPGTVARILADGILLATRSVASPDQDGDKVVTSGDIVTLTAKVGTNDPTGDLDCDPTGFRVTANDVALAQGHVGHNCDAPTPSLRPSWGRIKLLYR